MAGLPLEEKPILTLQERQERLEIERSQRPSFCSQMRSATREVHKVSDTLVNLKVGFALSDNSVWLDGLVVFHPIFRYLENNVSHELLPIDFHRTCAFQADIRYFCEALDLDWEAKYEEQRPSVQKYLQHLEDVRKENPKILLAYVYHLYMGLLSGGQILQKKRQMIMKMRSKGVPKLSEKHGPRDGSQVTLYMDYLIGDMKQRMRRLVDKQGLQMDPDLKQRILVEGERVFEFNNEVIASIKGVNKASVKKLILYLGYAGGTIALGYLYLALSRKLWSYLGWESR